MLNFRSISRSNWPRVAAAICLGVIGPLGAAHAEGGAEARAREQVHRVQEALTKAQADNTQLASDKIAMEQKILATQSQLDRVLKSGRDDSAGRAKLREAEDREADLRRQLDQATKRIEELSAKQRETESTLGMRQGELTVARKSIEEQQSTLAQCQVHNDELVKMAQGLLKSYHEKGVWAALRQKEPVLGFREVELENQVQAAQDRIDAQRVTRVP